MSISKITTDDLKKLDRAKEKDSPFVSAFFLLPSYTAAPAECVDNGTCTFVDMLIKRVDVMSKLPENTVEQAR